jgi:hypothetical protein
MSLIKKRGSSLPMNTSLKESTFSGVSQEYSKNNFGFLGIYGFLSFSIFSRDFSLDFAQPALEPALNLLISFSSFSMNSCSLL